MQIKELVPLAKFSTNVNMRNLQSIGLLLITISSFGQDANLYLEDSSGYSDYYRHTLYYESHASKYDQDSCRYYEGIETYIIRKSVEEAFIVLKIPAQRVDKFWVDSIGCIGVEGKLPDLSTIRLFVEKKGCSDYNCIKDAVVIGFAWRRWYRNIIEKGETYTGCTNKDKRWYKKTYKRVFSSIEIPGHGGK